MLAGVGVTLKVGNAGIAFALAGVFAFSYMTHLVERSRQRAQQYVSLSWGVLAGLMRSLDIRDQRAARHSAAVARFARDIAKTVGMSEAECELAHTAGLLHDIGRFALSDRVAERGRTLTDEDWMAIQRHPELGADMLRDLGMYGPVAEIVIAHHERIDGRGYPAGLTEEEIPEIAKIISVAEVYDTLTASDTYRTQMSSFEALNELRRVADIAGGLTVRGGARRPAQRRGGRVPPRRHGRLRRRARYGAADQPGGRRRLTRSRGSDQGQTPVHPLTDVGHASPSERGAASGGGSGYQWRSRQGLSARCRYVRGRVSADLLVKHGIRALLLQRADELVDLLLAEAPLPSWGAVGLQIAHIRPASDRSQRDAKRLSCLRCGQAQRASLNLPHDSHFTAICGAISRQAQQLHNLLTANHVVAASIIQNPVIRLQRHMHKGTRGY